MRSNKHRWQGLAALSLLGVVAFVGCAAGDAPEESDPAVDAEEVGEAAQAIGTCSHPRCRTGGPLVSTCDTCVGQICAVDPYCCTTAWDATCVGEVASVCSKTCTCPHSAFDTGAAMGDACSECVQVICNIDPFCCNVAWDQACVNQANSADPAYMACWPP